MAVIGPSTWTSGSFNERLFQEHLREVFGLETQQVDDKIATVFRRQGSDRYQEEFQSMGGMTPFVSWPEDTEIPMASIEERYHSVLVPTDYAKGLSYSHKLKRDIQAKYRVIEDSVRQFAMMAAVTQQLAAATYLVNGFTTNWHATDAVPLFSASHNLGTQIGGTYSNLQTGGPTIDNVESAINLLEMTPNDVGVVMPIKAEIALFNPKKFFLWDRIVNSPGDFESPNLTKNTLKGRLQLVSWQYLPEDYWFILAGKQWRRLFFFDRETLTQDMQVDFHTKATEHTAYFSCSVGAADWRGIVGSTG